MSQEIKTKLLCVALGFLTAAALLSPLFPGISRPAPRRDFLGECSEVVAPGFRSIYRCEYGFGEVCYVYTGKGISCTDLFP